MNFFSSKLLTAYRSRLPNYWDILAMIIVLGVVMLFAWGAKQMATPYQIGQVIPISLAPSMLPFYALRTIIRILIALLFSLIFTLVVGTWAAKNKRAEQLIIPMIDVMQSVPPLGFQSIIIVTFIALFSGSLLGPECAAIFVIFTSQTWNMTFSFYQTVKSTPAELQEAAQMFHLSAWQRFFRIEVPFSMPGLLWNTMMSMSASWFFVVAAEAINVSNQEILLPGIGSYIATAIRFADLSAIIYAILTMFIVIIIYDQLLFRPLVAWAEKFKIEHQASEKIPESWVINLFRRTRLMRALGEKITFVMNAFINMKFFRSNPALTYVVKESAYKERLFNIYWNGILFTICGITFALIINYFLHHIVWSEVEKVFLLGLITASRVFILILICSIIWVPVGVYIGLRPRVSEIAQPIAQLLAAFPANLFYPLVVLFIVTYHLSPNVWLTPLMILGAQWYILFNVIAGASTIPKELFQVTDNLGVKGFLKWRRLLLPGVFPYYVTGAISAAGGAWNASIVAEVANWGAVRLHADGLGSYISLYSQKGDFAHIALGIGMMCLLVLIFNRILWRPLYAFAINRFSLE